MTEVEKVARDALKKAAEQFDYYAECHRQKGTADGDEKEAVNRAMAADMRAAIAALDAARGESADERQAAIVSALRDDAQRCDCFARSEGECTCGAWDTEPGERSYKRKGVEDIADWIESGEWRRAGA